MLINSIFDDILTETYVLPIVPISFDAAYLCNENYIKKSKILEILEISNNSNIVKHPKILELITLLNLHDVQPLDAMFLNVFYRKLLRARLENDYLQKDLPSGLIITTFDNAENDYYIVKTLRLFRVLCKYLHIKCTFKEATFKKSLLNDFSFWESMNKNFMDIYGENTIPIINNNDNNTLLFLGILFDIWSGSILTINNEVIKIVPATFITRLL